MRKSLCVPLASFGSCARLCATSSTSSSTQTGGGEGGRFRPSPGAGSSSKAPQQRQANPYKSWEHMNHKWLIMMCVGCLAGGIAAGQVVDVDESALRPPFAKDAVLADINKTFEFRPDLAATSIRVAFILAARRAGFATENIDESCAAVSGLEDIAGVLRHLSTVHGLSMEDAASLLALAAVKFLKGPCDVIDATWRWGRNDTDVAPTRKKHLVDGSSSLIPLPIILEGLGGLTDAECVALMACHSVGEFHEHVSGIDAVSHIGSHYKLSNEYYKFLLENENRFFNLEVPRTEENKVIQHLPKDFVCVYAQKGKKQTKKQCVFNQREVDAILKNKAWRKLAEQYAKDEAAWAAVFQSAFVKMIECHFKRLRPYSTDPAQ